MELPPEILSEIFLYLPGPEIARISQVSKDWNESANQPFLWKNLLQKEWLDATKPSHFIEESNEEDRELENEATHEPNDGVIDVHNEFLIPDHDPKKVYLKRMDELLQWNHHYKLIRHHFYSPNYPFYRRFWFQLMFGLRALFALIISSSEHYFVTPKYLHKNYVNVHFEQRKFMLDSSRDVLYFLCILFVTGVLYFNLFDVYVNIPFHMQVLSLLILVISSFWIIRGRYIMNNYSPSRFDTEQVPWYALMMRKILKTEPHRFGFIALNYMFVGVILFFNVCYISELRFLKLCLIIPLSIAYAVDMALPIMIFETYSVDNHIVSNANGVTMTFLEGRTLMGRRYLKQVNILSYYSLPLTLLIGILIGTGGPRIILEIALLLIIILIKVLLNSNNSTIHLDSNFTSSIVAVIFYSLISLMTFILYFAVLYYKMRFCWKLAKIRSVLAVESIDKARLIIGDNHLSPTVIRLIIYGFQILSWLLLFALFAFVFVGLFYY